MYKQSLLIINNNNKIINLNITPNTKTPTQERFLGEENSKGKFKVPNC